MDTDTEKRQEPVYRAIASAVDARLRCQKTGNTEWLERWGAYLQSIQDELLPSGSGLDCGTTLDLGSSTGNCVVLHASFHHMDENGSYDGWTDHTIRVRGSMIHGIELTVSGPNRNDIKGYLYEIYEVALMDMLCPEDHMPS